MNCSPAPIPSGSGKATQSSYRSSKLNLFLGPYPHLSPSPRSYTFSPPITTLRDGPQTSGPKKPNTSHGANQPGTKLRANPPKPCLHCGCCYWLLLLLNSISPDRHSNKIPVVPATQTLSRMGEDQPIQGGRISDGSVVLVFNTLSSFYLNGCSLFNSCLSAISAHPVFGVLCSCVFRLLVWSNKILKDTNACYRSCGGHVRLWILGITAVGLLYLISPAASERVTLQHQFKAGKLCPLYLKNSDCTPTLIGHIRMSGRIPDQCITILRTGTFSVVDCSLPPACGETFYRSLKKTWYKSEVGLCYGVGEVTSVTLPNGTMIWPLEWAEVYKPVCKHSYTLVGDLLVRQINPNGSDSFWFINQNYLFTRPFVQLPSDSPAILPPSDDEKYCYPSGDFLRGPYNEINAARHGFYFFASDWEPCPDFIGRYYMGNYTYFDCNPVCTMRYDLSGKTYRCSPAATTTNLLPLAISSIPHTIGHVIIVAIESVIYYVRRCLWFIDPVLTAAVLWATRNMPFDIYTRAILVIAVSSLPSLLFP